MPLWQLDLNQPASSKPGAVHDAERWERFKASLRARVEHPFRVLKRQFGYTKVRYRGLAKNTAQVLTLFALSNLWMVRRQLLPVTGSVRL
jgi:IS5 family transposase